MTLQPIRGRSGTASEGPEPYMIGQCTRLGNGISTRWGTVVPVLGLPFLEWREELSAVVAAGRARNG